ncbi:TPA: hypothetical protein ACH3X1_016552 [Trebouxia sp. C0004]
MRIAVRPSKFHWGKERAAVFKSPAALNREIDFIGCTAKCNNYLKYNGRSCVNVFFDIEWMQDAPVIDGLALARIIAEVINPVIAALFNLTTHSQVADEIVVEQCHKVEGDQWKASFHVIFPDFCCTASNLSAMADALDLPEYVDRTPFTGQGRRLMRMVGACKEGTEDSFKPTTFFDLTIAPSAKQAQSMRLLMSPLSTKQKAQALDIVIGSCMAY